MLKKTIAYIDYNFNQREEDFYFNLSKAELLDMEMSVSGGLSTILEKIVSEQSQEKLFSLFKDVIIRSYGEKSADGKRFIKNQELTDSFVQTEAYSNLIMELVSNSDVAVAFINGVIPNVETLIKKA